MRSCVHCELLPCLLIHERIDCSFLNERAAGQIGIQHTDNTILERINRGHGVEETIRALRLLKDNCFKVSLAEAYIMI